MFQMASLHQHVVFRILFCLFACLNSSFAQTSKPIEFELSSVELINSPSAIFDLEISSFLRPAHLSETGALNLMQFGFSAHKYFVSTDKLQGVVVVQGLAVKNKAELTELDANRFLSTFKSDISDQSAILLWIGFSKQEVMSFMKKPKNNSAAKFDNFFSLFVNRAQAIEACPDGRPLNLAQQQQRGRELQRRAAHDHLIQQVARCGFAALNGARGRVSGIAEAFQKINLNPRVMLDKMTEEFKQTLTFIQNIIPHVKELLSATQNLSSEQSLSLVCEAVGSALTSAALGAATGGVGAILARAFQSAFSSMSTLIRTAKLLKDIPQQQVKASEFSLLQGAMSCPL